MFCPFKDTIISPPVKFAEKSRVSLYNFPDVIPGLTNVPKYAAHPGAKLLAVVNTNSPPVIFHGCVKLGLGL